MKMSQMILSLAAVLLLVGASFGQEIWEGPLTSQDSCDAGTCCCFGGSSEITQEGAQLSATIPISSTDNPAPFGNGCALGANDFTLDVTLAAEQAQVFSFDFDGETYRASISGDGTVVTFTNEARSQCTQVFDHVSTANGGSAPADGGDGGGDTTEEEPACEPAPFAENGGYTEAECDGDAELPWAANKYLGDSFCDLEACCCIVGESTPITQDGTRIRGTVQLDGACSVLSEYELNENLDDPKQKSLDIDVVGRPYTLIRFDRNDGIEVINRNDNRCSSNLIRECDDGTFGAYPEEGNKVPGPEDRPCKGEEAERPDEQAPPPSADGGSGSSGSSTDPDSFVIIKVADIPEEDNIPDQVREKGWCLGLGACSGDRTCYGPTPALPWADLGWTDETFLALTEVCPPMSGFTEGCCPPSRFDKLAQTAGALFFVAGACLSCYTNLLSVFCSATCSPDGSTFLEVMEVVEDPIVDEDGDGFDSLYSFWKTEHWMNEEAGRLSYESCIDVNYFAATPIPVFNVVTFSEGPFPDWNIALTAMGKYNPPSGSPVHYFFNRTELKPDYMEFNPLEVSPCWRSGPLQCDATICDYSLATEDIGEVFICEGENPGENATIISTFIDSQFPGTNPDSWDKSEGDAILAIGVIAVAAIAALSIYRRYKTNQIEALNRLRESSIAEDKYVQSRSGSGSDGSDRSDRSASYSQQPENFHKDTLEAANEDNHDELAAAAGGDDGHGDVWVSKIYKFLHDQFLVLGVKAAMRPWTFTLACLTVIALMASGLANFNIETDPIKLFVSPTAPSKIAFDTYAEFFNPYHRIEYAVFQRTDGQTVLSDPQMLEIMFDFQDLVQGIVVDDNDGNPVDVYDLCYSPTRKGCVSLTITQYFQNNRAEFEKYKVNGDDVPLKHVGICLNSPLGFDGFIEDERREGYCPTEGEKDCPCRGDFGAPIDTYNIIFADYEGEEFREAKAVSTVLLLLNSISEVDQGPAIAWEREFIKILKAFRLEHLDFMETYYYTTVSLGDEISSESSAAGTTVAISYVVMFIYISLGIVNMRRPYMGYVLQSHILLGIAGLMTVLLSTVAGFGFLSYFGVSASLVVMQVVPFLQLAIGVDNVFLLVSACRDAECKIDGRCDTNEKVAASIATALAEIGPSMTLASLSTSTAMSIATLSAMPAIRNFALFASVCVFLTFIMQVTLFPALLSFDMRRANNDRADFLFCVPNASKNITFCGSSIGHDPKAEEAARLERGEVSKFKAAGMFITGPLMSGAIVAGSVLFFFICLYYLPYIKIGLEVQDALPPTSHAVLFLNAFSQFVKVGVPVYFVVGDQLNYTDVAVQTKFCASVTGCSPTSVGALMSKLDTTPEKSYIATRSNQWLDDLLSFGEPLSGRALCCRRDKETDAYVVPPDQGGPGAGSDRVETCINSANRGTDCPARFAGGEFMGVLHNFLRATPSENCVKSGAAYKDQIYVENDDFGRTNDPIPGIEKLNVRAASYRMYNTPLDTQEAFINSYKQAIKVVEFVSEYHGLNEFFTYASHHPFFEQYVDIEHQAGLLIGLALVAVFVMHLILYGSIAVPTLVVMTIGMVVTITVTLCATWEVQLNSFSLVNFVITVGISDSISHLALAFLKNVRAHPEWSPRESMVEAFEELVFAVFFGNIMTTILGVAVLAFAKARVFEKYYFRMYLILVLVGAYHGLVFIPAVLAFAFWKADEPEAQENEKEISA